MSHNFSETPVIKFNGQDYNSLLDRCLSTGLPFEDETFPAEISSIGLQLVQGKNLSSLRWMRPKVSDGASRRDCWFLAALGSLTQNLQQLQKILMDQSFSHQYAGIFRFRFWQCGQWVEVVVDDRLPVLNKECLFVHPRKNNQEFWPCLLEKAYAKFHGSYVNLHYGFLPDALVDLTGGVVTSINPNSIPSDLVMMVKTAVKTGSLMACGTLPTGEARRMENGLVTQHAYTVTGAERIQYGRGWEDLIRLWNPWGHTEWIGRWSDRSPEWQKIRSQHKRLLYKDKEDGEFWMSCQDFQDNFFCLYICNQCPISLNHRNMPHERWSQMMFKNRATPGNTAGKGPLRDMQYIFSVPESMEHDNVITSFNVMPQNLKAKGEFPLTFEVFKFQPFWKRLPSTFFSQFRNAIEGVVFKTKRNLTKYFSLNPGTYVVVISAYREEVEFLLRILLKMPDGDRYRNPELLNASLPESDSQESIFHKYSQQGLYIDATQLQNLLNQEFLKGTSGDTFSLDECRSIVALMDLNTNGRLEEEEFARLWGRLVNCQVPACSLFVQLRPDLLAPSLLPLTNPPRGPDFLAGTSISNELLDLMILRYSDNSGRVSFPSLVCFLLRLEAMASKRGSGMHYCPKWMNLVMYN
uniref:Calpain 13 n=1 Tax=Canis lupus dingo TaxID=286419 RepID=A0A8C0LHS3_CANLU